MKWLTKLSAGINKAVTFLKWVEVIKNTLVYFDNETKRVFNSNSNDNGLSEQKAEA